MRNGTNFEMIAHYKKLIESVEGHGEQPVICNDQRVPDSQFAMTMKTEIKTEQTPEQNFCPLPLTDFLMEGYGESISLTEVPYSLEDLSKPSFHIPHQESIMTSVSFNNISQTPTQVSRVSSTGMCPPMSSTPSYTSSPQPLQMISQSLSSSVLCSPSSAFRPANNTKTRMYVTGLAGSGGTVTTNSANFISSSNHSQDEMLEYTDLDKAVSFYDDFETSKDSIHEPKKPFQMQEGDSDGGSLEEAISLIIHQESSDLNIPFDPYSWTCQHVNRWIGWVCQKHGQCDMTSEMAAFNDGQTLCSWRSEDFDYHFGRAAGNHLYNELELWKSASTCIPFQNKSALGDTPCQTMTSQNIYMGDSNTFSFSPASSPALSSCGSTSPDSESSNCILSQPFDMADDNHILYPEIKQSPKTESINDCKIFHKRVPGRGHKKSIALWQFLRKLLLSEQNYGCIRWIDRKAGIFKIEDSKKVATLWGTEKNRPAMNYDKLSRSVRQYYKKGIIKKPEQSKRLLYQFCPEYL